MSDKIFTKSQVPIRRTVDLLPEVFKTESNAKFMAGVIDPLIQPGVLEKTVGYIGRRYGKTFNGKDIYLDTDQTLRSRYQLEPAVVVRQDDKVKHFYDYIDFKNQLRFFGNTLERDDLFTEQDHYSWNPPIDWDKFVNYREYYWVPMGPSTVQVVGQGTAVTSTYRVRLGDAGDSQTGVWTFTPDGLTNNPSITLYRGQTYTFNVNSPRNSFYIRSSLTDGMKSNYNKGVSNNGTENGKVTFTVPFDAPDLLFYQSNQEPERSGKFLVDSVESNSKINVEDEIVGKSTYKSSNGIEFTNGLIVEFVGQTLPKKYQDGRWLIEGVGNEIRLVDFDSLKPPAINNDIPEVLFDNNPFDTEPYDDATAYPGKKDYITINRASIDNNPWSRYNRWFHRSVLEYASNINGTTLDLTEDSRAKRPIIEFVANLQLFNHGAQSKLDVDYIDTFTKDVFSTVEGSTGYNIDGEFIFEGARILFIADTDNWVKNKIYRVTFINHNNKKQISLLEESDTESKTGECVLVKRGKNNAGVMYHFDGNNWLKSQEKTKVNQTPQFDAFDKNGISFSDVDTYPVSSFAGCEFLSYKINSSGPIDSELGFRLSYLNIDNVGDIQFEFDWDVLSFTWQQDTVLNTQKINSGFYKINSKNFNFKFENGWTLTNKDYLQPVIDTVVISEDTNTVVSKACEWKESTKEKIIFYVNGNLYLKNYIRPTLNTFVFETKLNKGDTVTIKVYSDQIPDQGYYEIPLGLERNPLNADLRSFTFGQATDHVGTIAELAEDFRGTFPGDNNLRDLAGYQNLGRRFLKHSGSVALPISLLCNKDSNVIRSIQFAKKSYTEFKNSFISMATDMYYDQEPKDFVDEVLSKMTAPKTSVEAFADSDMLGSGAYTKIEYLVEDEGIKTFALNEKFYLTTPSRKAVYVYINGNQLLVGIDYEFNSTFGFVTIIRNLVEGDQIEIREYVSTSYSFVPATPTSLGMYKKFTPMMFIDDTYQTPTKVIQGHDGSLTVAYNDVRDDIILELEKRIYNNIKQEYDENYFDIDKVSGGYYGSSVFKKSEVDTIVSREFLQWIANTDIDYTENQYFDSENSFTYTYTNMTDPTRQQNLPGFWRGVYMWFYDTDRPHRCPWEMLGFSQQPNWWVSEYGPGPYTSGNLILWEDLENGLIRQGSRAGQYDRYKRPGLSLHIPVDSDGKLLSPLDSGLAQDFSLINNQGDFVFGDNAPAESAWRRSSEWPYAVIAAITLLRPFEFIVKFLDTTQLSKNIIDQYVNSSTDLFTTIDDIVIPVTGETQTVGIINWIMDYLRSKSQNAAVIQNFINGIDINITNRISGFVDQTQQRYLLDSKSPKSASSSVFVPQENYDIFFNVSVPISTISYSGVVLEKNNKGWKVTGYDSVNPFFNYLEAIPGQSDPLISVGGVSESFVNWTSNKFYNNGQIVRNGGFYYRTISSHTSDTEFNPQFFRQIPKLPQIGSIEAFKRRNFNTLKVSKLGYGTTLTSIQQVVDFLLGYEQYLISIGMVFDQYDPETQVNRDWFTAAKEFLFWTKHNWAEGSLLTLSPSADKVDIVIPVGVADNLLDDFYDYQIFKSDGTPLLPNFINVNRDIQRLSISKANTTDGIYFIKVNFVLKEHVVVFSDKTVFNDVIYDKPTGYRQDRIKVRGFRTTDWDGDYTSPGFLFDNVNIDVWQPFTDYKLGDIVAYREFFWTSKENQQGVKEFDNTRWTKLDLIPNKGLVSNFDYKINQFEDFYNLDADGVGSSQRDLARHGIGYQTRTYLQNLAEDEVTQFKIYQGFIREKGTANAISKVFGKLSNTDKDSITLNEEWAFRVGKLGGVDQINEYEFKISRPEFTINPQPLLFVNSITNQIDRYVRLSSSDFTIAPIPYSTNINPTYDYTLPGRSAGYVKNDQIEFTVKHKEDILNFDISKFKENDHVWVTFADADWTVLRYNVSNIRIVPITDESTVFEEAVPFIKEETRVTVGLSQRHNIAVGDIVGIKNVTNLTGFFKVSEVGPKTITVEAPEDAKDPVVVGANQAFISLFTEARFKNYESLNLEKIGLLKNNSKLWVDNNGQNQWEVINKVSQYSSLEVVDLGVADPSKVGSVLLYSDALKQIIVGIPQSNFVVSYNAARPTLAAVQFIAPPSEFELALDQVFGESLALSPDSRWLIVGSPKASGVESRFKGLFNPNETYEANDIVLYNNSLWRANTGIAGDGSTINIGTESWSVADLSPADSTGSNSGYFEQGMISIYEWGSIDTPAIPFDESIQYPRGSLVSYQGRQYFALVNTVAGTLPTNLDSWQTASGRWNNRLNLVSPRPAADEKFGSKITISKSSEEYYMAVASEETSGGTGKVYLYKFDGITWKYLQEPGYSGVFDGSKQYPVGSVVWANNNLYKALVNNPASDPLDDGEESWELLEDIPLQNILPGRLAVDDSSNINTFIGIVGDDVSEIIKEGDKFGHSLSMNQDGSILVVGAPYSDGKYFPNYKGIWESIQEYQEDDHVKVGNIYYRSLVNANIGLNPLTSGGWVSVSISDFETLGKVFVYQKNPQGKYKLIQTISKDALSLIAEELNTLTNPLSPLESGDLFGFAADLDSSGNTLVISAPFADRADQDQGSVYVFYRNTITGQYVFAQKLESFELINNQNFGNSISISQDGNKIVVGAQNTPYIVKTDFDLAVRTTFDSGKTQFIENQGTAGSVYVFEKKNSVYLLGEKLDVTLSFNESFGASIDATNTAIVVGSPGFVNDNNETVGKIRFFTKAEGTNSWSVLTSQNKLINIELLKALSVYDPVNNVKLADVDILDSFKLKVLGAAEQEIKFKTPYDPAIYKVGTDNQVIDPSQAWFEKHVGEIWWDVSTAKWVWYEQGDIAYRSGNWNQLAEGASIDIYEWVESILLPSEWLALADTADGLAEGISGQPLYPDDTVYNFKQQFNPTSGEVSETKYYYWVKNKNTVPGIPSRRISAAEVASLIINPVGSGLPIIALIDTDKILAYNFSSFPGDTALVNIQYVRPNRNLNLVHLEYQLLSEGNVNSIPTETLEQKWIDSLIGFDKAGNQVPDPNLPAKQKYGIEFRPRQSMFVNRSRALKIAIDRVNNILKTQPFTESLDFRNLSKINPIPDEALKLYDQSVETFIDLETVGTARLRQAILRANVIEGQIDTIDIVDPGFGYKVAPPVDIQGTGKGARAEVTIDNQGRINSVRVLQKGKKYSSVILRVRSFSVLVKNDVTSNNFWTIYSWDQKSRAFFRSKTQEFNTPNYWSYVDWWEKDYGITSRIVSEVSNLFLESELTLEVGDLLRVKEYGNGGWAVLERTKDETQILGKYKLVGRENGTIQLKEELYNLETNNVGYDNKGSYDSIPYDQQPINELRNIFDAIKNDILTNELAVEWNKLFFSSIGYVFSEQLYVDWAFKTSFMSAIHKVGDLVQKTNYKNDNLESFKEYIDEVKPYRTKIREYTSQYTELQPADTAVTDFDNPPVYSTIDDKVVPVKIDSEETKTLPWKWWAENRGYSVINIVLSSRGEGYTSVPRVLITSNSGTGAKAQAFISNGRVSGIRLIEQGSGYLTAPTVTLVGGNGGQKSATAVAILGEGKTRNFDVTMKFDRISKTGIYSALTQEENFVASGSNSIFDLNYAPTRDKSRISVVKNNELILNSEYQIDLFTSTVDSYSLLKGRLRFNTAPAKGDSIKVVYDKNDRLLDATNRIEKLYSPKSGMLGFAEERVSLPIELAVVNSQLIEVKSAKDIKEGMRVSGKDVIPCRVLKITSSSHIVLSKPQTLLAGTVLELTYNKPNQLMTGIDFGGVMIQGNPFDVTGGWDALPWFTDSWDSVESSADFYVVADGSTDYVSLPSTPAAGQQISIYVRPVDIVVSIETASTVINSNTILVETPFTTENIEVGMAVTGSGIIDCRVLEVLESAVVFSKKQTIPEGTLIAFTKTQEPIRVDDPDYPEELDGETMPGKPNVRMKTFVGTGNTRIIDLPNQLGIEAGDTLIFRTSDSDGSVTINDVNLIDTNLNGGTLETMRGAYVTATGRLAEDIIVEGEKFISPDQVPATEENVPGQVLDSVSIKVFHSKQSGAPSVLAKVIPVFNGQTEYEIGQSIIESGNLSVYVDKIKKIEDIDFIVDYIANTVRFLTTLSSGSIVEIISIGLGGQSILDYQEFVADGETRLFLTNANYNSTAQVLLTINGNYIDSGFTNSRGRVNNSDKTLVEVGQAPVQGSSVKIVVLGASLGTDTNQEPVVRVNQQTIIVESSTRNYLLDNFVDLNRSSARGSIIVELNGRYLKSSDTVFIVYDGTNNVINLGVDPLTPPGTLAINDLRVYKNNVLLEFLNDWVFDGTANRLEILPSSLSLGDAIKVEQNINTDFNIVNGEIILDSSLLIADGDQLIVTWFNEYPSVDLLKEVYSGGKSQYPLARIPVSLSYLWVFLNGNRLTADVDFTLSVEKNAVVLLAPSVLTDIVEIIQFGSDIYRSTVGYEIFEDMLNTRHFKRFSLNDVQLAASLNYFDQTITVTDASSLSSPDARRRIPGIISINGERIEYFVKNGNVLSQLRRGSLGTPIAELHTMGSKVADVGASETIPYTENQEKIDIISDGSTIEFGPYNFISSAPTSNRPFYKITVPVRNNAGEIINTLYPSIPQEYEACDEVEIFVGGRRLNKDSTKIYEETLGASSPSADIDVEADFSVNRSTKTIRLTSPVPAGIRITILRRTGKVWLERSETSASKGISMLDNNTVIVNFIEQKSTLLP
jgi:hypothetical protein